MTVAQDAAIDGAGNKTVAVVSRPIAVDTIAPPAPLITNVANNNAITSDNLINAAERDSGVVVSGTSEPNAAVTLTFEGGVSASSTTRSVSVGANSAGGWSYKLGAADYGFLGQGQNKVLAVRAIDAVGNVSAPTTQNFSIDTQAPQLSLIEVLAPTGTAAKVSGASLPIIKLQIS